MEEEGGSRAKRQRVDKSGRFAALEKFKKLKGTKNKYEIDDVDNIFEEVDEKEYSKRVYERQSDDWIVDDDGAGYVEDGRDIFDDDLDSESIANSTKTPKAKKKRLSKLADASAGTGNIAAMLSAMPEKKKKTVNLDEDELLSEILGSINEEKPKETPKKSYSFIDPDEKAAKDYMKNLSGPRPIKTNLKTGIKKPKTPKINKIDTKPITNGNIEKPLVEIQNLQDDVNEDPEFDSILEELIEKDKMEKSQNVTSNESKVEEEVDYTMDDDFHGDFDVDEVETAVETTLTGNKLDITEEQLVSGWETTVEGAEGENKEPETQILSDELPTVTNEDGQQVFRFFWWDAYEDYLKLPGVVFLFGKVFVESAKTYASCCVAVRNIERKIYLLPRPFEMTSDLKSETDTPVKIRDVYNEFNDTISEKLQIKSFRSRKVVKKYAFDPDVPEQSDYLEIRYPASNVALDPTTTGRTFSRVFGTQASFLENLLLERKIKGPCYIDIVNPSMATTNYSYCKYEINCNSVKDLVIPQHLQNSPPPPMTVMTLNIRSVLNPQTKLSEIVMIGCLVYNYYHVGKKVPKKPFNSHFCVFTKPPGQNFPVDLYNELQNYKGTKVQKCDNERAMLNYFVNQLEKIDPDLIIGHDLIDYYLGLIGSRIEKINFNWSRLGKLKRSKRPMRSKDLMVGHLVCDLKISAKELIKAKNYDLDTLFEEHLGLTNDRLSNSDVDKMFFTSAGIIKLISLTMDDAFNISKIVYDINAIPLALQITNIAGNVMSRTLLGGRSERNEFLLLHAFTEKDYIPPDKFIGKKKVVEKESTSKRKKPQYAGGLVLDPKVGFYNTFILLMDFNSLYPSIIQEFNICFTTMPYDIDPEQEIPDTSSKVGILPTEISKLVESRREVKKLMTNPDLPPDLYNQYHIRQMALKLTANSMYGCLGFSHSRFYAMHLASLVTYKGRDILTHTRDLVQGMSLEVIYGDTDSIMINTNTTNFDEVMKVGQSIKKAVNKNYKQLELEIDGVFKYMLLLKKKKYAAVTMSKDKIGKITLKKEYKGLDIVRRDWCSLAAEIGKVVLDNILSDQSHDERIENIEKCLNQVATDLNENKIPYPLLVITKQLSKDPKQYAEKNILPHVFVALRHNESGKKPLLQGDMVPYVICKDDTENPASKRAYHIEELKRSKTLKIDIDYYLSLQIHPVVCRLCEPLEGLDSVQIANMLGLDPKQYKSSIVKPIESNSEESATNRKDFHRYDPFTFRCLSCHKWNIVKPPTTTYLPLTQCSNPTCSAKPYIEAAHISNSLHIHMKRVMHRLFTASYICEDPMCPNEESGTPLKFLNGYPVCTKCDSGLMYLNYTMKDSYYQLKAFENTFDLDWIEKKSHFNQEVVEIYKYLKEKVSEQISSHGYGHVDLSSIFNFLNDDWAPDVHNDLDDHLMELTPESQE